MYKCIPIAPDGSLLSEKAVVRGLAPTVLTQAWVIALKVARNFFDGGLTLDALEINHIEEQWSAQAHELLTTVKKPAPWTA